MSAERYGRLKAQLRNRGTPIPKNDLCIAALSLQHNLTPVTRDNRFQLVAGLTTEARTEKMCGRAPAPF